MANYNVTDYQSIVNAINTANTTTANDNLIFQNDVTLTAEQTIDLFNIPANAGTLRFRSQQPTPAVDPPVQYKLIVTSALNIADNTPATAQPSFTIGPFTLQIGNGGTDGSIAGNLRVDDGGILIIDRSAATTYTGTLSVEDEDNGLFNSVAGTTVTFDGSASTTNPAGVAIRASQGTGAASSYELEIGGDGDGVISGVIADGGLAAAPGSFTKTGDGTWTFSGNNTYVGETTVEEGTLVVASATGLGAVIGAGAGTTANPATAAAAGTVVEDGATLALTSGNASGIAIGAEALSLAGQGAPGDDPADEPVGALTNVSGANSFAGNITLTGDTLVTSQAGSLTLSGAVTGAFGLTLGGDADGTISGAIDATVTTVSKEGDGTWTLSNANNAYAGGTVLREGTLDLSTVTSAGTGNITFADDEQTLAIDSSGTLANTISAFGTDDFVDLTSIDFEGATITTNGNTVTVTEDPTVGADSNTLNFDSTPTGYRYAIVDDGNGGTDVVLQDALPPATPGAPDLSAESDSGTSDTDNITNVTQPTFTGTTEAGATVKLYEGDTLLGTTTADDDGAYSVTTDDPLDDGDHTLTVTSTDEFGNTSDPSPGLTVTIDTTAPATPGAPSLDAASDTGPNDGITADTTPTFSGMAGANEIVTLYDTQTNDVLGTTTANNDGSYSITSDALDDGSYEIGVRTTDVAGNESDVSDPTTVTIDTAAPPAPDAPTLTAGSDTGLSRTDGITRDTTPTFIGTAEAGATIKLYDGDTVVGTTTANDDGDYIVTASTLTEGEHTITVKAIDGAGNMSDASGATDVTIDTTPPGTPAAPMLTAASDTGAADGVTSDTTPTFTGTVGGGERVTLYDGSNTVIGTTIANNDGSYSITSDELGEGAHNIRVRTTDAAGNSSGLSGRTSVTIDTTQPDAPDAPTLTAASDTGLSRTDGITKVTAPTFTGTAEAGTTVTLYDGTQVIGTGQANANGVYRVTVSTLGEGDHTITATATDGAGQTSPASTGTAVTIDTTAPGRPGAPTLTAASDTGSSDNVTSDTTPTLTGTGTAGDQVTLYDAGTRAAIGSTIVGSDGTYSITSSGLGEGAHNLYVTETDAAGNTSANSARERVVIDTTKPAVRVTSAGGQVSQARQTITGTGEAGSLVTVRDDQLEVGTVRVGADGTWSKTIRLHEGDNRVSAFAEDRAGNTARTRGVVFDYERPNAAAPASAEAHAPAAHADLASALFDAAFSSGHVDASASLAQHAADPAALHLTASAHA